ncbi:glycoside hydrolase family 2 protein [Fulvivirga lutimaris]|uniref:glycoside hydrolase family 2 protein n=1 Tax=Fulvivirga lutimaris TaxID=1819566 RepID=UPI0012BC1A3A|nr:GNAT family N-acetyltransferase [Fulvivirga lutimaris]MTI38163.1 GNAT family N-acetyltransferase [Fulvivirga lutimaris]
MKNLFRILVVLFATVNSLSAQNNNLLINAYNRKTTSLNGPWKYIVDPYENGFYNYRYEPFENQSNPGKAAFFTNSKPDNKSDLVEYDFDKMDNILVPGDWNTQKENLYYYEGTVWYKKSFDYDLKDANRAFAYFEASNYQTDVYLNGKKLGRHVGGFTPFNFEITDIVKPQDNFLVVKVDNKRIKDGVPTLNTDWWNYGGITRDIKIIETSKNFIQDYFIQLAPKNNKLIKGYAKLDGEDIANKRVSISIPELKIKKEFTTDDTGQVSFEIDVKKVKYWSVNQPYLYDVTIETAEDKITDKIGFRTIETSGTNILLNGESVFLKGISIHEESPSRHGRGYSKEDAKQLLQWAKELGCNYVRLAHYPHNEHMVRLADQMGILVWEENPVYWTISWDNESTYENAENQLSELITRDKNRASVIIWSMANETPTSEARNSFLNKLAKFTRAKDPTRLISAALEQSSYNGSNTIRTIHDPFAETVDILSFNQYIGWYDGLPEKCSAISWKIDINKPVIISEFGAGAKYGLHGDKEERWTEEYQEDLYLQTLKMLDQIDQLKGISPWILVDFRSPRRVLAEIQEGWNRKGLISEQGEKKKAFFVLKNYYDNKKTE